jgi:hypothetical protein
MIWFNSKKARKQLINNRMVVTCRKRRYRFGSDLAVYTDKCINQRVKIGKVSVEFLSETINTKGGLLYSEHRKAFEYHLKDSGFDSVEAWESEVLKMNKMDELPNFLVFIRVTLL